MGQEYSMEIVERAEQLWCVDGHTFEAVATLTGVAVSSLKRWSERYNWPDKREKIRQALSSIRTNTIMLRARLIENCLDTLNAQDAFAVASIEGMVQHAAEIAAKGQVAAVQPAPESLREIQTDEDAVEALDEALRIKLNMMLADPGRINLSAVRDVKQVMDFLSQMRSSSKGEAQGGKKALSPQSAEKLQNS